MQIVSLVAGLAVAIGAFFAVGGWEEPQPQRAPVRLSARIVSADPRPASAVAAPAVGIAPSVLLLVADSQAAGEAARARYAAESPGWRVDLVVFEPGQNRGDLDLITDSLGEAAGRGLIDGLRIVYVHDASPAPVG